MGFIWVDSVWGTITKYATVAIVAGSIGFYKGCSMEKERHESKIMEYNVERYQTLERLLEDDHDGYNR